MGVLHRPGGRHHGINEEIVARQGLKVEAIYSLAQLLDSFGQLREPLLPPLLQPPAEGSDEGDGQGIPEHRDRAERRLSNTLDDLPARALTWRRALHEGQATGRRAGPCCATLSRTASHAKAALTAAYRDPSSRCYICPDTGPMPLAA